MVAVKLAQTYQLRYMAMGKTSKAYSAKDVSICINGKRVEPMGYEGRIESYRDSTGEWVEAPKSKRRSDSKGAVRHG